MERVNRTLGDMLSKYTNEKMDNWDEYLAGVTYVYNTAVHHTTNKTPFFMMFGRNPRTPGDWSLTVIPLKLSTPTTFKEERATQLSEALERVKEVQKKRLQEYATQYRKQIISNEFQGTMSMVYKLTIGKGKNKKFVLRWSGP